LVEDNKFIDMCAVCKQGVLKIEMIYKRGRIFHPRCYETQGFKFPPIDHDLAQLSARTRIELVQMKNLKVRSDAGLLPKEKAKPKKKAVKKSKVKKSKVKKAKPTPKKKKKPASKRRK